MHRLLALLFLFSGCTNLFFFPSKQLFYLPTKYNLDYKEYILPTSNNNRIASWLLIPKRKVIGTVIFLHGNAENISTHFLNLAWMVKHGYQVFLGDYQGYGKSEGGPSPQNAYHDGLAMLKKGLELHKENKAKQLIVYGQSLGGNITLNALKDFSDKEEVDLLVIDSSFLSFKKLAFEKLTSSWVTILLSPLAYILVSDSQSPKDDLDKLKSIPTLVIHGTRDQIVPFHHGEEIYKGLNSKKWFWQIQNGLHTDVFFSHERQYRQKFLQFLKGEKN